MLIGTKVTKPCPLCGKENEIQHEITRNNDKYWYQCINPYRHVNTFYIERLCVADVINDIDILLS